MVKNCLACVLLATSSSVGLALYSRGQAQVPTHCQHVDKTGPKVLLGSVKLGNYDFDFLSDVDRVGTKYSFIRLITNNHRSYLAPVEWAQANLWFAEIKPRDCGRNRFETSHGHKQVTTKIKYGPALKQEADASLYDMNDEPKGKANGLESEIVSSNVHFTFNSRNDNKNVTYVASISKDSSKEDLYFKIDSFDKVLKSFKDHRAEIKGGWYQERVEGGDTYYKLTAARRALPAVFSINNTRNIHMADQPYAVELFLRRFGGKMYRQAKGVITLHVPADLIKP